MTTGGRSGGLRDDAQETGAPILGDDALQRLEQRLKEHLDQQFDQRLRRIEERFDEIADRFEALGVDANRNRRHGRRPGADVARGDPVNRFVPVRRQNNPVSSESSEEEEDESAEEALTDYGGRQHYGRFRRGYDGRRRYDEREGNGFKLKVDIPYFNGGLGIEDFLDWIADIDKFFDYMETPSEKRVRLVACRLKGGASAWWERLQNRREREGRERVRTWHRMKRLLKQEFLPPDYEQIMFQQYQRCQQGNRTIHEYTAEFMRLAERNNLSETEGQQVARYLDGLKPFIRDKIGVQVLRNLSEAKNMAMKAELMLQEKGRRNGYGNFGESSSMGKNVYSNRSNMERRPEDKVVGKPSVSEAKDKGTQAQRTANPNPYVKPAAIKCYRCNQPGHRSNECPQRKTVNMTTREEEDDEYCCEPDGEEEEFDEELEGEVNCVVRRMMLVPKQPDDSQRHQLFRTRCTILGKIFAVVVDSGSMENIIGKEAVKKLGVQVEKHPNPYTLGWIKSGMDSIQVTERCKIPFSIGKYQDELYCDIVDMDVCHVLFGRPWQYDVDAQHSGRSNQYSLVKDGVKYTLLPLKKKDKQAAENSFLTLTRKFEADIKETRQIHALVVK